MSLGLSAATWMTLGSTALGAMSGGNSQGGTTTQTNDPWSASVPWLKQQIQTGQGLQQYYQQNPFNAQQQQAYANMGGNSNYARQLASSVLGQLNNFQPFDRNNPTARPGMFQLPPMASGAAMGGPQPSQNLNISGNPFMNGAIQQPVVQPMQAPVTPPPSWAVPGDGA